MFKTLTIQEFAPVKRSPTGLSEPRIRAAYRNRSRWVGTFTIEMERNAAEQANLFRASARIGLLFSALQDAEIGQRRFPDRP